MINTSYRLPVIFQLMVAVIGNLQEDLNIQNTAVFSQQGLNDSGDDIREPAWGPLIK
jgi:hypothetical protein